MLQKEEERARKKIEQTKERALEILLMRAENEKRVLNYFEATGKNTEHRRTLQSKARENDYEMRRQRAEQLESIHLKRREDVTEMQQERKELTRIMLKDQEKDLRMKQRMREEIRKKEEEARNRREMEKRENDRKIKEAYEKKAAVEESDARKAEKLVKALERREREWMIKLRDAQSVQETAFEQLETALLGDSQIYSSSAFTSGNTSGGKSDEEVQTGEFFASSSGVSKNSTDQTEKAGEEERVTSPNHEILPTTATASSVRKVSGRAAGAGLPRVAHKLSRSSEIRPGISQSHSRGRIDGLSGGFGSGTNAPSASIDRTKKRSSPKKLVGCK